MRYKIVWTIPAVGFMIRAIRSKMIIILRASLNKCMLYKDEKINNFDNI